MPSDFGYSDKRLEIEFPHLRLTRQDGQIALAGKFPVRLTDGTLVDYYYVEIRLPINLDSFLPIVLETGGRIPRVQDRHCNENGFLCVLLPETRYKHFPMGSKIIDFLKGPLNSFLFGQSYFEANNDWPFGEWKHGIHGRLEFYREFFGVGQDSAGMILGLVETVANGTYRRHKPCPCGSGKKTKKCHWEQQGHLDRLVGRQVLASAIEDLRKIFQEPR